MVHFILILSVVLGAVLGGFFGKNEKLAKQLLIISAGFLITICLNEVFPLVYGEHFRSEEAHFHGEGAHSSIGLFVVAGVILQMFLESITKGFEHGHIHHHNEEEGRAILPSALVVGLFIHAFIEGIPLAGDKVSMAYLLGIAVHNLPISFVLGAFLFSKKWTLPSVLVVLLFALASPAGVVLGKYFNPNWQPYFLALVGGIFIHISSVIIFESNKNHRMDWAKIILVMLGVALAYLTHLAHSH